MKLALRIFQALCGLAVVFGAFLMMVLGSPLDAFVAGVDLFAHFLFMIGSFSICVFGALGILWASRASNRNLLPSQALKELSKYAVLPIMNFAMLWTIWAIAWPISIVRFSSGESRGGQTRVYFVDKFEGYRLQLAVYERIVYENGDYDEFIALGLDKSLEIRHKDTSEIYLETMRIGDRRIEQRELAAHSQDLGELRAAIQKGQDRFVVVTVKNEKPWF